MGELVREGAVVVIAGPPNAGKSSLFNALLGRSRATLQNYWDNRGTEAVIDTGEWPLVSLIPQAARPRIGSSGSG